jgi:hypothetical protein
MPLYVFETPGGEAVEVFYEMSKAPSIGSVVDIDGFGLCKRVPCLGGGFSREPIHFTSQQITPWHPAAPRHNKYGEAQFQSRAEIREFEQKTAGAEGYRHNEL